MPKTRKLLSIGHSYVVSLNRRLVNEIARLGQGEWEVTTVAPAFIQGDLRPMHLETDAHELCRLEAVPVYYSKFIHIMTYGWRLRDILQQNWDLVHCWEEPYILSGAQVAWWKTKKSPLIYSTFQNKCKQYPPPFNWIEQYAMSKSTGWIAFGKTVAEALKSRPGYSSPMQVITPGVDIQHFYPCVDAKYKIRRCLGWEEEGIPVIGYLGRFVPEKGLDLLMAVLDRLETPWRALFVGTGVMESSLRNWAKRYPKQVRICTDVKHHEVPQYLNAMDMLVAPSQTVSNWQEQFGRMLIEAFACAVPVIGSDSGEIPYVIQDAGLVVGENDQLGWVAAISDLLNSPSRRQELGKSGLERAHNFYTWTAVAKQHLQFFNELL
ncbi:glycosyltransferase family 4 protein [Sphaerospermopsis aphanizomenoides BCCUSP55]|uniref:glycosyltransferase family 4 protein n=1 Tax=Sphaerospermopsis aphanizomenoides TaxID=459663 RepID=UPI001906F756|nr:glycosyltransferase family 4 protein [Sphaerospermopsis aphanizomenoides]MBK1987843.1 glycosyltransferase family 4 protein [Sphaerospermopsis aphanizomenoides BCCUSP55]